MTVKIRYKPKGNISNMEIGQYGGGNKNRTIARFPYGNIIGKPKGWGKKDKAYQQLLVNIEFIAEAREGWPEAIKRATDAEKALDLACERMKEQCPANALCMGYCEKENCENNVAKCWKEYFLTKARESHD